MKVQGMTLLTLLAGMLSSNVLANSDNPLIKFGTLTSDDCTPMLNGLTECKVDISQEGFVNPLVFVMPTIDAALTTRDNGTLQTELPSTARVTQVNSSWFTVTQMLAPFDSASLTADSRETVYSNAPIDYVTAPMRDIDYFVIEEGEYLIGGETPLIAGSVNINEIVRKGSNRYRENASDLERLGSRIDFASYMGSGFSFTDENGAAARPGVLVEVQSINNTYTDQYENGAEFLGQPKWMTAFAGHVTEDGFNIALELSEVREGEPNRNRDRNNQIPSLSNEKVAFVAGLGSGYITGKKYWLGSGSTVATGGRQRERILDPVSVGCAFANIDFSAIGFRTPPVLVASKNSRNGGDGGWLRRCNVDNDSVSFIVEEDMDRSFERAHGSERASFFMFEDDLVTEHCEIFQSTLATWNGSVFPPSVQLSGNAYVKPISGLNTIGFPVNSLQVSKKSCQISDGSFVACEADPSLILDSPPDVFPTFPAANSIATTLSTRLDLTPGSYGQLNDAVVNNSNGGDIILKAGTYYFESITLTESSIVLDITGNEMVIIYAKHINMGGKAKINEDGDPNRLLISQVGSQDVTLGGNASIVAHLVAQNRIVMSGSQSQFIRGAVATPTLQGSGNGSIIGDSLCPTPSQPEGEMVIEVDANFSLTCDVVPVDFKYVYKDGSNKGLPISGFNESFSALIDSDIDATWCLDDACTTDDVSSASFVDGEQTLYLRAAEIGNVLVSGQLQSDSSQASDEESVEFVPYQLRANPEVVELVAGTIKDDIEIRAIACQADNPVTVSNYVPSAQFEMTPDIEKPSGGDFSTYRTDNFSFVNGVGTFDLEWDNVGELKISLVDPEFDCTGFDDCPIAGGDETVPVVSNTQVLSGSFTVRSRPWTFAICSSDSLDGTAISGSQFAKAGEGFDLILKPVIWSSAHEMFRESQKDGSLCGLSVPSNFFTSDPDMSGELNFDFAIASPANGDQGSFTAPRVTNTTQNGNNLELLGSGFTLSEVGSFHINVDMSNGFYDSVLEGIENGEREIGRITPYSYHVYSDASLKTEWLYSGTQPFTYMGQAFAVKSFYVEALGFDDAPLKNFVDFASDYKPDFVIEEQAPSFAGRLIGSASLSGDWGSSTNRIVVDRSIGNFGHSTADNCTNSLCWLKEVTAVGYEDGPFNYQGNSTDTTISISSAATNTDPVTLTDTERVLDTQPDIRFGRLRFEDVAGSQSSSIQMPVAAQYWTGANFITAFEDSNTYVDGADSTIARIWPTGTSDVSVSGDGKLVVGRNHVIEATQTTAMREQVEVELDLSLSGNGVPWLQYDWDQDGNEQNPTGVVTFGIYRGNDRVMFRGEPNITP